MATLLGIRTNMTTRAEDVQLWLCTILTVAILSGILGWDDIRGVEHCLSNGRKKYSARLANVPASIDAMEACKATPVTINDICYTTPMHCENRGCLGGVYGHWIVENEGVCAAYWELIKQKINLLELSTAHRAYDLNEGLYRPEIWFT